MSKKILIFDTEGSYGAFRPWEPGFYLTCLSYHWIIDGVADEPKVLWMVHNEVELTPMPPYVAQVQRLVDEATLVVAHNLKHDLNILRYYGVDFERTKLWCTMLVEYLLEGQDASLEWGLDEICARRQLGQKDPTIRNCWEKGMGTHEIPKEWLEFYAKRDVELTGVLYMSQSQEVIENNMEALVELQNEFTMSLSDMEMNGFVCDAHQAEALYNEYHERACLIREDVLSMLGDVRINLASGPQLSAALFGGECEVSWKEWVTKTLKTKPETRYYEKTYRARLSLPGFFRAPAKSETKKDGVYSTDKNTIEALPARTKDQRRIKELLLDLSKVEKICETLRGKSDGTGLISKIIEGVIHPKFNQCVTATGRLSSSDPNSQNLPRGSTSPIKQCIRPAFDTIVQFDLSQIEWRAAAWLSQDRTMIHEINSGVDQHIEACTKIMGLKFTNKSDPESKENRNYAKVFNFRMIYGGTAHGFFSDPKMPEFSKSRWGSIVSEFYTKYSGLKDWQDINIMGATVAGRIVLPTGRRFHFNKTAFRQGVYNYNERQFKNYPVQGLAGGDILPLVCILCRRGLRENGLLTKLILTVHDSIVFDCPQDEVLRVSKLCMLIVQNLPQYIEDWFGINWNVKLDGEIEAGPNYGSLKEIKLNEIMEGHTEETVH